MSCPHPSQVYSGEYFASIPPRWHWICPTCGETGADPMINPPAPDLNRFQRLYERFGRSSTSPAPSHSR